MTFYQKHNHWDCELPVGNYADNIRWKCDVCGLVWAVDNSPNYTVDREEDMFDKSKWREVPKRFSGWTAFQPIGAPEHLIPIS